MLNLKNFFSFLFPLTTGFLFPLSLLAGSGFWEISAHRGDRATYRENSLSGLIHAMDIGATSVEFDVHLTKDGVPIIYHDYKLKPADFKGLNEPVLIKTLTLKKIQELRYSDSLVTHSSDQGLVTLHEFLLAVKIRESLGKRTIALHLEIKSEKGYLSDSAPIDQLALAISQTLNLVKPKTPIIVRAFNWDVLAEFKKHQPNIPQVLLVDKGVWKNLDFAKVIQEFKPTGFAPHFSDLTRESITYLLSHGIEVNPWTVNSPAMADELVRMGVTGITTDTPAIFLERYRQIIQKAQCTRFYRH